MLRGHDNGDRIVQLGSSMDMVIWILIVSAYCFCTFYILIHGPLYCPYMTLSYRKP